MEATRRIKPNFMFIKELCGVGRDMEEKLFVGGSGASW